MILIDWIREHPLVPLAIGVLFLIAFWFHLLEKQIHLKWYENLLLIALHEIVGFAGIKLLGIIETGDLFTDARRLYGMLFTMLPLYWLFARATRREFGPLLDAGAGATVLSFFIGRFHCFRRGCCYGVLLGGVRFPTRELDLVFYVVFLAVFLRRIYRGRTNGEVYPIYMMSYGLFRFVIEFFREDYTGNIGPLHLAHIWSLLSMGIGAAMYIFFQRKTARSRQQP